MSIILDALKKAETDRAKTAGPSAEKVPPVPVVINPPESRMPPLFPAVGIICGALLLAAVCFWGFRLYSGKETTSLPAVKTAPATSEVSSGPQDTEALKKTALDLYAKADFIGAGNRLEEAAKLNPQDAEIYNNLGLVLKKLGKADEAEKAYQQALSLKGDYPEALNNLGALSFNQGNFKKARELFEKAISLKADYATAYFHLALTDEKEGLKAEAVRHYEEGLKAAPVLDPKIRGQVTMRILILKGE